MIFYSTRKIYSIIIEYYDKASHKNVYKYLYSSRGVVAEPYVNQLNMVIVPESVFEPFIIEQDLEINGDNMLFHCGEKIYETRQKVVGGKVYSGRVTVGYKTYDFSINRKYIVKYHINYLL